MKPTSSVSRSDFALVALLALAGCASHPTPATSGTLPPPTPDPAPPGTVVTLEFANGTSKASMQIDLSSTDLQLEMRTRPRRDSAPAPRVDTLALRPSGLPGTATSAAGPTPAAPTASAPAMTDSVTASVVAGIRKAQDLFVRRQYAESLAAADATIALRPTAEAQALAGSAAWTMGDREQARARWRAALALDPDCPGVAEALARSTPSAEPGKGSLR